MAEQISSVKSSGGDHTHIQDWADNLPADPAAADPETASVDEAYDCLTTAALTVSTSNTNSATFKIRPGTGYAFTDAAGWPVCGTAESQSARMVGTSWIRSQTAAVVFERMMFASGSAHYFTTDAAGRELTVDRCVVFGGGFNCSAGTMNIWNTMHYGGVSGGRGQIWCSGGTLTAINCTVYGTTSAEECYERSGGTFIVKNCIGLQSGAAAAYSGTFDASSDNNMSDDTTAPGTTTYKSVTIANIIASTTGGSEDLHRVGTTDGSYEGSDETGTIGTLDIDGNTRSDLDIGADEINSTQPTTTNLISWWALEETSGTRVDSHGSNDLTDVNTVGSAAGKVSTAASLTRANQERLTHADNSDLSVGSVDFTLGAWVNATSFSGSSFSAIVTKWPSSYTEYALYVNTSSVIVFRPGSLGVSDLTGDTLSTSTWYFVVAWYDTSAELAYLQVNNGVPVSASTTSKNPVDSTGVFAIGAFDASPNDAWNGLIDEAFFFKRVLTADERTWLYNSGAGRAYADLSSGASVKTVSGLALASVKTVNGLAIASVKTINGASTA